jgi:hypothetical protein
LRKGKVKGISKLRDVTGRLVEQEEKEREKGVSEGRKKAHEEKFVREGGGGVGEEVVGEDEEDDDEGEDGLEPGEIRKEDGEFEPEEGEILDDGLVDEDESGVSGA